MKILISTVLFNMNKNSYHNFYKYLNGISIWIHKIHKYLHSHECKLLVYYDDSITSDELIYTKFKKITNHKLIETRFFNYDNFKSKIHKHGHKSTFGTLVRFEPLFNHDKYDLLMIRDLDVENNDEGYHDEFIKFITDDNYTMSFYKNEFHDSFARHLKFIDNSKFGSKFNANGSFKIKFDKSIYDKFLEYLIYKNNHELNNIINKTIKYTKKHYEDNIFYGIDEIFMNMFILNNAHGKLKIIYYYDEKKFILNKLRKILKIDEKYSDEYILTNMDKFNFDEYIKKQLKNNDIKKLYNNIIL
jgi:hypothetical protein